MKIDMSLIGDQLQEGNIRRQKHPDYPLWIYKYTQQCVYQDNWNDITTICRGLVLDDDGNVVVNCIPKFFNHDEKNGKIVLEEAGTLSYEVTEKMDGSLIQVAVWDGKLIITSSGSFTSPQALKAKELLDLKKVVHLDGLTYIYEIIYPENRIVVDYGDKTSLTLLAIRNTEDGSELGLLEDDFAVTKLGGMYIPEIIKELERDDYINKEGYVIRFSNGSRIKFKYKEYMRLHKIFSGVNEKYIWESLRDGKPIDLVNIPDELFDFIKVTTEKISNEFQYLEDNLNNIYDSSIVHLKTRKEQAMHILNQHKALSSALFLKLDGGDYRKRLWDMVKPECITRFGMGQNSKEEDDGKI